MPSGVYRRRVPWSPVLSPEPEAPQGRPCFGDAHRAALPQGAPDHDFKHSLTDLWSNALTEPFAEFKARRAFEKQEAARRKALGLPDPPDDDEPPALGRPPGRLDACLICGGPIPPGGRRTRYCSRKCVAKAAYKKNGRSPLRRRKKFLPRNRKLYHQRYNAIRRAGAE